MRTGSTWVHEILVCLVEPARRDFVSTVPEALKIANEAPVTVLKSHALIDVDVPDLHPELHVVRVLRNFKDSLISRALYCRNVRRAENLKNLPDEAAAIERLDGLDTPAFVNAFLRECEAVPRWLEEIVVYERGEFDHTFYYEMLLHNPHDQFLAWANRAGYSRPGLSAAIDSALEQRSYGKMKAATSPGFVGSTGVGQWMAWLDEPVARYLDGLYRNMRSLSEAFPGSRSLKKLLTSERPASAPQPVANRG